MSAHSRIRCLRATLDCALTFALLSAPLGAQDAERAIVGESLAGLFIVETILAEPTLFDHYVAFDPSLWWNGGALLDSASARLAASDRKSRTLYLASSKDDIDSRTAQLAGFLRAARPRGLAWVYEPSLDQTHATIFRAAGPGALALALW